MQAQSTSGDRTAGRRAEHGRAGRATGSGCTAKAQRAAAGNLGHNSKETQPQS